MQASEVQGEVGQVGTRTTAGAARGAIGGHLAYAQGRQGSRVDATESYVTRWLRSSLSRSKTGPAEALRAK